MSLSRYVEYKDSGAAWLGMVPAHWDVHRLGFYFNERRQKVSDTDYPPLSVTKGGIVPQLETAAKTDDGDNRKLVCIGDFVINSRSDRKGSAGAARQTGSVSLISTVLQPTTSINIEFAHHLLRSIPFQEEFYRYGKGIVADLWSTNYSEMRNILLALPSTQEQTAIAAFLNAENEKIDTLIAEQEKLIALLAEKRQATISHAVTRGLNPDAPMKDSGVAWLGEIPAHWEVKRLKHLGQAIIGLTYDPAEVVQEGEGTLVLRASNVQRGQIELKDNVYVDALIPEKLRTQVGDILICSRNGSRNLIGKNALIGAESAGLTFGAFMLIFRGEFNAYLSWVFNSQIFKYQSGTFLTSTINQLTTENLYNFEIPLPSVEERSKIIEFLTQQTMKIDALDAEAERSIALLKERRSALIAAAVTGQIDVRNTVMQHAKEAAQTD